MASDRWLYALSLSAVASSVAGLLVPLYLVRIGGDAAALGLSASLASLVGAPGAVFAGRYADRTGNHRGLVLTSLAVSAVTLGLLPLIHTVPAVIAVNALLAFALAAIAPVVTMLVVGDSPESNWGVRIARLNTVQGYGATAGLVIGSAWTLVVGGVFAAGATQASLFVLAAAFGVASAVLAARSLPRADKLRVGPRGSNRVATILTRTSRTVRDATVSVAANRIFWAVRSFSRRRVRRLRSEFPTVLWIYFGAAFLFFTGFAVFWAPLPLYLTTAGFSSGEVFALYLVNNVASMVLYGGAGRLVGLYDVRLVQGGALGLRAGAFLGVGILGVGYLSPDSVGPLAVVMAFLAVVGVTWAFIAVTGTAIVSRHAPESARGGILGLYAALSAVGGSLGSLFGGWLAGFGFGVAVLVAAALVVAGGTIVYAAKRLSIPAGTDQGTTLATD